MWLNDYELLGNAEQERFKKLVNYLLNKTFVLREIYEQRDRIGKINADYRFVERNYPLFSDYLDYAGYTLNKDDTYGIIFINSRYEYNVLRLDKFTTLLLLTLRSIYDEEKEKNTARNVVLIRMSDVLLRMIEDKLVLKKPTIRDTVESLRLLIKQNVIAKIDGQLEDPTCLIAIYPSIIKVVSNEKISAIYSVMFKENEESRDPFASEEAE